MLVVGLRDMEDCGWGRELLAGSWVVKLVLRLLAPTIMHPSTPLLSTLLDPCLVCPASAWGRLCHRLLARKDGKVADIWKPSHESDAPSTHPALECRPILCNTRISGRQAARTARCRDPRIPPDRDTWWNPTWRATTKQAIFIFPFRQQSYMISGPFLTAASVRRATRR